MNRMIVLLMGFFLLVPFAWSQGLDEINVVEMSWALKCYQGIRPGMTPSAAPTAPSYAKPEFLEGLGRDADSVKERDLIRTTYNLTDVRPTAQAELWLKKDEPSGVVMIAPESGRPLTVMLERLDASWLHYRVSVYEKDTGSKAIMRSAFTIPSAMTLKDAVVFGFEDADKNPVFLSLRISNLYAEGAEAGAPVVKEPTPAEAGTTKGQAAAKPVIVAPRLIRQVPPVFPETAKKAGLEGTVVLSVTLDDKGRVIKARVIRSIPELDQAAFDAVRQWTYEPMTVDGKPKPVVLTVNVDFKR